MSKPLLIFLFQITETYSFLPREAVTRFLLGCTECQRRPRSPSPGGSISAKSSAGKSVQSEKVSSSVNGNPVTNLPVSQMTRPLTTLANTKAKSMLRPPVTSATPLSPTPGTALSTVGAAPQTTTTSSKPREGSHAPDKSSLIHYRHARKPKRQASSPAPAKAKIANSPTPAPSPPVTSSATSTPPKATSPVVVAATSTKPPTQQLVHLVIRPLVLKQPDLKRDTQTSPVKKPEPPKYNPLSIVNLLRKSPDSKYGCTLEELNSTPSTSQSEETRQEDPAPDPPPSVPVPLSAVDVPGEKIVCNADTITIPRVPQPQPEMTTQMPQPWPPMTSHPLLSAPSWNPSLDLKSTPVEYGLSLTSSTLLKHYQILHAEKERLEELKMMEEMRLRLTLNSSNFNSLASRRLPAIQATDLIDTNINLLSTIEHLHYQLMMALTEGRRVHEMLATNTTLNSSENTAFTACHRPLPLKCPSMMSQMGGAGTSAAHHMALMPPPPIVPSHSRGFMLYPGIHIPDS